MGVSGEEVVEEDAFLEGGEGVDVDDVGGAAGDGGGDVGEFVGGEVDQGEHVGAQLGGAGWDRRAGTVTGVGWVVVARLAGVGFWNRARTETVMWWVWSCWTRVMASSECPPSSKKLSSGCDGGLVQHLGEGLADELPHVALAGARGSDRSEVGAGSAAWSSLPLIFNGNAVSTRNAAGIM